MRMYCRHCHEPQEIRWLSLKPLVCPVCKLPTPNGWDWLEKNDPNSAWELTHNDKRFLKSLRIDVERT